MSTDDEGRGYRRVRRPKDKEELVERLRDDKRGAFREIRDVLVLAAALGFEKDRFVPFEVAAEQIRWETFTNRYFSEELVKMVAVAHSEDKEIASADRQPEQLEIFEGYINGGLEVLNEELSARSTEDPLDVLVDLIAAGGEHRRGVDVLIDLAAEPSFD